MLAQIDKHNSGLADSQLMRECVWGALEVWTNVAILWKVSE
jgi:hypothetical protein